MSHQDAAAEPAQARARRRDDHVQHRQTFHHPGAWGSSPPAAATAFLWPPIAGRDLFFSGTAAAAAEEATGGTGPLMSLGAGFSVGGGTGTSITKFPEEGGPVVVGEEEDDFSAWVFPPPPPASSTVSRTSSSSLGENSWSPVQTEFAASEVLRAAAKPAVVVGAGEDGSSDPVTRCQARRLLLPGKEPDLQAAAHVCLWGSSHGPCRDSSSGGGGFATREELNWHVKRAHLLECPVPSCGEGAFASRELLDCHIRWAHGKSSSSSSSTEQELAVEGGDCRSSNLLIAVGGHGTAAAPETSGGLPFPSSSSSSATSSGDGGAMMPVEDRLLKMAMSVGIAKKRCRDQVKSVAEKRLRRSSGNAPKTLGSSSGGSLQGLNTRLAETLSFPIIWEHGVLPFLIEFLPAWCGADHAVSVLRGRKPGVRRVCFLTRKPVRRARRLVIAGHVRDLLPDTLRDGVSFVFATGEVDRLVWARGLSKQLPDETCAPRNPFAYISPCMGDSIGASSRDPDEESTATLGPCVMVDGASFWLANFHPFVDALKDASSVTIEHPSPADRAQCADERHDALSSNRLDFRLGELAATSGYDLKTTRISHHPYWNENEKEPPLVVTDWALVSAATRQANMLRKHPSATQRARQESIVTTVAAAEPESTVISAGRTSGLQSGVVCETPAYISGTRNGTGKASREWFVEEEPFASEHDEDAWIRGGIGVPGDSGAAVVHRDTHALVGQLWGRNRYYGPGPRVTYFTPMADVFDDIQERCGQPSRPQLPQYRDEADRWPVYPVCRPCFDLREYLDGSGSSRRSSRESMLSLIGMHDGMRDDVDVDVDLDGASPSELATPKDHHSYLVRNIGPDVASPSAVGGVSPAPLHAFHPTISPGGLSELRSPYPQALNEDDLFATYDQVCPNVSTPGLGKRPAVSPGLARRGSGSVKRQRNV
ncbi:hypothetical protein F4780DRAFT_763980 [Xylariomycetidae sp. FL0641]|nr:hypothetical protein F4780DRAFT_763980 [Xylariomycetidae sp. FL0641]